ncbi:zinc ribbon domain-containing protein [Streptomyces hydrogenans]|uniref:zinc ribbon domain-containing protein n=1 Tax=Streptomyces hydrogenans TaxID=1873719 RepID=UPI0035DA5475
MKKFRPRPGFVVQAFRFALDPNAAQEQALRSHCGAARAAYNWAVAWVTASWLQRGAEETYGIPEGELTPWRPWSLPSLRKAFNEAKKTDRRFADWWEENSKEAYSTGLSNAAAAFDNHARSKNGKRRGKKMGAPRFKAKRKARPTCRFTTGTIRVEDGRHVTLPRLAAEYGTIVIEDLNVAGMLRNRRLARRIADAGFGEIRRQLTYKTRGRHGTRIITAGRWYPSSKTCSGCGAVKAKLPLHIRTYDCDVCGLVIDRDDNAGLNLVALAATGTTGTGVAGDRGTPAVSKPRGADQKTRITHPRRKTEAGRAGGATPAARGKETRDRTRIEAPTLW